MIKEDEKDYWINCEIASKNVVENDKDEIEDLNRKINCLKIDERKSGTWVLILSVLWIHVHEGLSFDLYGWKWSNYRLNMLIILGTRPSRELRT